jgi:hypothetical protein
MAEFPEFERLIKKFAHHRRVIPAGFQEAAQILEVTVLNQPVNRSIGFQLYRSKPVEPSDLILLIEDLVKQTDSSGE